MSHAVRIALLVPQDIGYGRAVLRGVQEYALQKPHWIFRDAAPTYEVLKPLREWQPHGIIALLFDKKLADALRRMNKPLVNTTSTLQLPSVPLIENDHEAIGKLAAEYFLQRGFRNFGYVGSSWMGALLAREAAFRDAVEAAGHSVSTCRAKYLPRPAAGDSWVRQDRNIDRWLRQLPKPVALLAQNDVPARDLADRCRELKLAVPHEVSLMGIDNDELECHLCHPPLTSIAVPGERIGMEAARVLEQLLLGHPPQPLQRYFPPVRVVTRQSTDTLAVEDELVRAALRFIHEHACSNLTVHDLVQHTRTSRRMIERRFGQHLGSTPLEEIHRVRLERAKELLAETDLDMARVAAQAGFSDQRRLSMIFKQQTGQSPLQFRRAVRSGAVDDEG